MQYFKHFNLVGDIFLPMFILIWKEIHCSVTVQICGWKNLCQIYLGKNSVHPAKICGTKAPTYFLCFLLKFLWRQVKRKISNHKYQFLKQICYAWNILLINQIMIWMIWIVFDIKSDLDVWHLYICYSKYYSSW